MRWKGATPRTDSATEAGFGDVFFRKMVRQHGHGCKACPDEAAAEDTKHPPTPPCLREEQGDVCVKDFRWLMKRPLHAFQKITLRFLTGIDAPSNKLPRTFLHVRTYRKRGTEGGRKKCRTSHQKVRRF